MAAPDDGDIRVFIPKGDGPVLQQYINERWCTIPVVYEDPGEELVGCPWEGTDGGLCEVCGGEGSGLRREIEKRLAVEVLRSKRDDS